MHLHIIVLSLPNSGPEGGAETRRSGWPVRILSLCSPQLCATRSGLKCVTRSQMLVEHIFASSCKVDCSLNIYRHRVAIEHCDCMLCSVHCESPPSGSLTATATAFGKLSRRMSVARRALRKSNYSEHFYGGSTTFPFNRN